MEDEWLSMRLLYGAYCPSNLSSTHSILISTQPGIVMSVYALLRNAAYHGRLTVDDVELEGALDGNLCRCTGYKPILDAAKTFVGEYMNGDRQFHVFVYPWDKSG